jgi:hypothetical protein
VDVEGSRVTAPRRVLSLGLIVAAALAAGCGGGNIGPAPVAPASVVTSGPTAAPSSSGMYAVPTTAGTIAFPTISGLSPSVTVLAGAPAGLTLNIYESLTAPATAPAPSAATRRPAAVAATPFLYLTATFSGNLPAGILASEMLSAVSPALPSAQYYVELDDLTAGTKTATYGPGLVVNGTATIANGTAGPAFTGGHMYLFQFYSLPLGTATPSPSPSPTATATASPSPSPSPTATASPTASPTPVSTASPTPGPSPLGTYTFSGPSATGTAVTSPAAPAALSVPASGTYGTYGVRVTVQFGAATTTAPFALTAALGSAPMNDISPSAAYPFYSGSAATPLFYTQLTTSAAASFAMTPAITVVATSFVSSNTCSLFEYGNSGSGYVWAAIPGASGTINGNTVIIPSVALPGGAPITTGPSTAVPVFIGC